MRNLLVEYYVGGLSNSDEFIATEPFSSSFPPIGTFNEQVKIAFDLMLESTVGREEARSGLVDRSHASARPKGAPDEPRLEAVTKSYSDLLAR